ncbi:YetF domain-containing protein [Streptomyces sp. NPDC002476]|uniref:YetF domain-containing protein n=1 Tax=Streptomyces sp. NPDC002476 TaxID=3364648 RepID=UPI0036B8D6BB
MLYAWWRESRQQSSRTAAGALRHLALRPTEVEHAVRLQNGDDISMVAVGRLEPDGQLVIVLKPSEQNATRADVQRLETRLGDRSPVP